MLLASCIIIHRFSNNVKKKSDAHKIYRNKKTEFINEFFFLIYMASVSETSAFYLFFFFLHIEKRRATHNFSLKNS